MAVRTYGAIDLGAGGGRVIAGHFDGNILALEVVHRFPNRGVTLPTGMHWNLPQLFEEILSGLSVLATHHGATLRSLAIDTWGVDYGLVDGAGRLLGLPWMYRDPRTNGWIERVTARISRDEVYRRTGIQFLPFNSIWQLAAEAHANPRLFDAAARVLFIPDLLNFWMTGRMTNERTIASTSQLLQAGRGCWDLGLATAAGIPAHIFSDVLEPCLPVGELLQTVRERTGCPRIPVVTCGSHDTASAVAGMPASGSGALFLSSGTWSLLGRELSAPLMTPEAFHAGFSNEHGLGGTTRFLKNVTGMWLLQECLRAWSARDASVALPDLLRAAAEVRTDSVIDPDDADFQQPCDMPAAIAAWLERAGRPAPASREETVAIILQSLALRYRELVGELRRLTPDVPDTLHVVGGGSQNALLNQMTADVTGLRVVAGPVEATAAGNILAQMIADGEIASLDEGREIARRSFPPVSFEPRGEDASTRFQGLENVS